LEQQRHAQHRWRMRLLPCAAVPVHPGQLVLERSVEQLVPVKPKKPEQRTHACQALHHPLLLLRQLDLR
jgi:hypothetical protein